MRYRDDGSTWSGIVTITVCIICFCASYTARDRGITFKIQIPQPMEVRK
jgi:hypothetical protein